MSRNAVMFRQNSKVEKIPDDESEELLSKETDEDNKNDQTEDASLKIPHSKNTSNNFMRALSRTSEKDENTTELTLNGNLHITMSNDETCGGAIKLRKDNCEDTQIDIEPDEKLKRRKQKGWCSFLKNNCSKQSILNIVYGLLITLALIIGVKALIKYSSDEHERYFYCYPCQNMNIHMKYTKRGENMCCTDNPVEETALPKVCYS